MTFPTKADIEFFKETKGIQAVIKAGHGSWVYRPEGFHPRLQLLSEAYPMRGAGDIVIPRLDQLIEMLEERGYRWELKRLFLTHPPDKIVARIYKCVIFDDKKGWAAKDQGPTPSIALGRALIEVLKEE